jgi:hypothetical protein
MQECERMGRLCRLQNRLYAGVLEWRELGQSRAKLPCFQMRARLIKPGLRAVSLFSLLFILIFTVVLAWGYFVFKVVAVTIVVSVQYKTSFI